MKLFKSLFGSKPNNKEIVKKWLLSIEDEESLPDDIIAINFGLFEPFGIEMIGSKQYDANDDDWACEEDYVPKHRLCPSLIFTRSRTWQEVLEEMILLMKELMVELPNLNIWKVKYITIGFNDGDLVVIKTM
jgi:hypothetical protein